MKNNVPRTVMSEALKHVKLVTAPVPENLLSLKEGMADENIGQTCSKIGSAGFTTCLGRTQHDRNSLFFQVEM